MVGKRGRRRLLWAKEAESGEVNACGPWAIILFHRLIAAADGLGRHRADPWQLKRDLFELNNVTAEQLDDALDELVEQGLVRVYRANGHRYAELLRWEDYNGRYIRSDRPRKVECPAPPGEGPAERQARKRHERATKMERDATWHDLMVSVLDHINESRPERSHLQLHNRKGRYTAWARKMRARLKEGATTEEMCRIYSMKRAEWEGTHMERHLHPSTIFRPSNYEKYLDELNAPGGPADELRRREYLEEQARQQAQERARQQLRLKEERKFQAWMENMPERASERLERQARERVAQKGVDPDDKFAGPLLKAMREEIARGWYEGG